ncbi:MAG: phosphate ABC transporter ATP-binding protein PstB [Spirochaetota bacterium]
MDTQTTPTPEVTVNNLELWFGESHVLRGITIPMYKRHVTAVIGPSGCGKSTMLRTINRMNDLIPTARTKGEILIDNENVLAPHYDIYALRTKVGMVFQKPNPFPKSIYENVAFGLKLKGIHNHSEVMGIVEKSLRDAWLWDEVKDRLRSSALSLSGGQQQRLCIARALATSPDVMLLDEPTSALDPQSTNRIEELLLELKKSVTIIIVTHNIGQAGRISDYTAFLYLGEVIEYGLTEKVFTVPKDKRTEEYLTGKFG